jgi:3D (Asp-Asp-Asp) domain-containing protein
MRRNRALTHSEQWDLGLLLSLFIVGLLVLTVLWRTRAIPSLLAMAFGTRTSQSNVSATTDESINQTNQIDPEDQPSFQSRPTPIFYADELDVAPTQAAAPVETKWFKGQQYKYVKTLKMRVTAYAPDPRCCWPFDGTTTASGLSVKTNAGKLVAADTSVIPFHDLVSISGYNSGQPVPVLDRGGAIKGQRLDVLLPTYEQAQAWGTRTIDVKIYAPM